MSVNGGMRNQLAHREVYMQHGILPEFRLKFRMVNDSKTVLGKYFFLFRIVCRVGALEKNTKPDTDALSKSEGTKMIAYPTETCPRGLSCPNDVDAGGDGLVCL